MNNVLKKLVWKATSLYWMSRIPFDKIDNEVTMNNSYKRREIIHIKDVVK